MVSATNRYIPRASGASTSTISNVIFNTISAAADTATSIATSARNNVASTRRQIAVDEMLEVLGMANQPFVYSIAGDTQGRPKIQRGFIRRSYSNPDNPLSGLSVRFMYNPEVINRSYASYMDSAALDPFNTMFESGNLIAPPAFIEFSFSLLFDRQQEVATAGTEEWKQQGVLHDLGFFDAVIRNVIPEGTVSGQIADNGVLMLNPEDITVVFSKDLTAQGKPTKAAVRYTRFNHKMVPTRCEVDITMMLTYFGPIQEQFGLDANQQIRTYESLIPYESTLGDGMASTRSIDEAMALYRSDESSARRLSNLVAQVGTSVSNAWWQSSPTSVPSAGAPGVNMMVTPVNGSIALLALQQMVIAVQQGGTPRYSRDANRIKHGPNYPTPWIFDCSSFVWYGYQKIGAQSVFGSARYPATAAMLSFWQSTNWATAAKVLEWSGSSTAVLQGLKTLPRPGDFLFKNGHIAVIMEVGATGFTTIAARSSSSSPQVGIGNESFAYCARTYNYILRPTLAGANSVAGGR